MTRTLVAGIGNVLMSDDAIGPYCVRQLMAEYDFPTDVELADLGTPGLDLTLHLAAADDVILIDALRGADSDGVMVYDLAALVSGRTGVRLDTHAPALEESIQVARLTGDRPRDVTLIGLAGANFDHGTSLSAVVRRQLPTLIDRVLAELTARGIEWRLRPAPTPADVWWEKTLER